MTPCADLTPFADGELSPDRTTAFRAHLPECKACQVELLSTMQLIALPSGIPIERERAEAMISLSFLTFALGIVVGVVAALQIHAHSHPDCPANRKDDP